MLREASRGPIRVFAVEDRSVQLMWSALPVDELTITVGNQERSVTASPPAWLHREGRRSRRLSPLPGGPGTLTVDGLEPATTYRIGLSGPGTKSRWSASVTTLAPPPGQLLTKFATVSDMHIGEHRFGATQTISEGPELGGPSAALCLRAALDEAAAWGATLMVSRGDLTRNSHPQEFAAVARILTSGLPSIGVLGNHDVRRRVDGPGLLAANGLEICTDTQICDIPGLRLVLGHSPVPTLHRGYLPDERIAKLAQACADAPPGTGGRPGPAAVVLHHPLTDRRYVTPYPPGIPVEQSARLGAALLAANPTTMVLAGHRHRNRRRTIAGVPVLEVGSTKDYPGQWAGYAVYEGGIRQVVHRISDPLALAWTEATRRALGGFWGRWSPGSLDDRCWVISW